MKLYTSPEQFKSKHGKVISTSLHITYRVALFGRENIVLQSKDVGESQKRKSPNISFAGLKMLASLL